MSIQISAGIVAGTGQLFGSDPESLENLAPPVPGSPGGVAVGAAARAVGIVAGAGGFFGGAVAVAGLPTDVEGTCTHLETGVPGTYFKPVKTWVPNYDIRYTANPNRTALAEFQDAPTVARLEPFGQLVGDSWQYNRGVGGNRYASLTGKGGLAYLAPELDLQECREGYEIPDDKVISPTCLTLAKLAGLMFAETYRNLEGDWVEGYKIARDGSGNLTITYVDPAGNQLTVITITPGGIVISQPIRAVDNSASPADSLLPTDHTVLIDNSFGGPAAFTFSLMDATSIPDGTEFELKKIGGPGAGRNVDVVPFGGQSIDGLASFALRRVAQSIQIKNYAGNWYIL